MQGDGAPSTSYTVPEAIDRIGVNRLAGSAAGLLPMTMHNTPAASAGFGHYQLMMVVYAGSVWAADAMEMMLLSFIGPAVRMANAAELSSCSCHPSHQSELVCHR